MSLTCLHCGAEILPPKRKFCSKAHKDNYNHKHLYNYKYTKSYRSRTSNNFMRHLLSYYKRSEHLDIEYLEALYEQQQGLCAISGVPMTHEQDGGKCPSNISIDRIDSDRGYEPGNVQLVCSLVNTMKMQYSGEELLWWCQQIVENSKRQSHAVY